MSHSHRELPRAHAASPQRALLIGLALSLAFVVIEAVTGFVAGSLALVSDAAHALADSAGLLLALAAATLARRPASARRTYGYARFEVLAVPLHVGLLLAIALYIIWESFGRLDGGHEVDVLPVVIVGVAGLLVNLFVVRLLHGHQHDNLNARAAFVESIADALSSVGVIISAIAIGLGAWTGIDTLVGIAIAAFILPRAWNLLRASGEILLESAPAGLDPDEIVAASNQVPGVLALHDVHVWAIAPRFPALSAHVEVADVSCTEHILTDLTVMMRERFGIGHVTLQPETASLHEAIECCLSPDAARIDDAAAHVHTGA